MSTVRHEIEVLAGENRTLELTVRNEARSPVDLTSATVVLTVKVTTSDVAALFTKSSAVGASEVDITFPLKGIAQIYIGAGDTDAVDPGVYVYDVWVTLASGAKHGVVRPSPFIIEAPVSDV